MSSDPTPKTIPDGMDVDHDPLTTPKARKPHSSAVGTTPPMKQPATSLYPTPSETMTFSVNSQEYEIDPEQPLIDIEIVRALYKSAQAQQRRLEQQTKDLRAMDLTVTNAHKTVARLTQAHRAAEQNLDAAQTTVAKLTAEQATLQSRLASLEHQLQAQTVLQPLQMKEHELYLSSGITKVKLPSTVDVHKIMYAPDMLGSEALKKIPTIAKEFHLNEFSDLEAWQKEWQAHAARHGFESLLEGTARCILLDRTTNRCPCKPMQGFQTRLHARERQLCSLIRDSIPLAQRSRTQFAEIQSPSKLMEAIAVDTGRTGEVANSKRAVQATETITKMRLRFPSTPNKMCENFKLLFKKWTRRWKSKPDMETTLGAISTSPPYFFKAALKDIRRTTSPMPSC